MVNIPENVTKICVHTGNILNLNEVKKNAGQNSSEELVESLKIALKGWDPTASVNGTSLEVGGSDESNIVSGVEPSELRTSVKVFITSNEKEALQEAVNKLFASLEANNIDSLVLAYTGTPQESGDRLKEIHHLWEVLESYVQDGKLSRIGISDVDTELFSALYNSAKVKPSIVQINLTICCVVPPALQEFCKQNEIQLLTHNDPLELLPREAVKDIFNVNIKSSQMVWAVRFQVHIKCRGVLAAKGYITCVDLT